MKQYALIFIYMLIAHTVVRLHTSGRMVPAPSATWYYTTIVIMVGMLIKVAAAMKILKMHGFVKLAEVRPIFIVWGF
ncbi:hypothetical protein [Ruminiclostridium sufflavum]|uniref:hypothetical protein n=1 Tax=Ruminiclostridium sufflavum TaxID=396504 RepID=UPI001402D34C|nr:hypothetical protein [Ruminiclostridium sufflavum]